MHLERYVIKQKNAKQRFALSACVCVCVQGINYLVENKLLDGGAQSIAEFLYKEEGLNKTAIGEFLGERWVWKVNEGEEEEETLRKKEGFNKVNALLWSHGPLSYREELHLQTLKAFVDLHEFSDLNLVQALR